MGTDFLHTAFVFLWFGSWVQELLNDGSGLGQAWISHGVTTVAFLRLGIERFQMASEPRVEKLYKTLILKPAVFIAVVIISKF